MGCRITSVRRVTRTRNPISSQTGAGNPSSRHVAIIRCTPLPHCSTSPSSWKTRPSTRFRTFETPSGRSSGGRLQRSRRRTRPITAPRMRSWYTLTWETCRFWPGVFGFESAAVARARPSSTTAHGSRTPPATGLNPRSRSGLVRFTPARRSSAPSAIRPRIDGDASCCAAPRSGEPGWRDACPVPSSNPTSSSLWMTSCGLARSGSGPAPVAHSWPNRAAAGCPRSSS